MVVQSQKWDFSRKMGFGSRGFRGETFWRGEWDSAPPAPPWRLWR